MGFNNLTTLLSAIWWKINGLTIEIVSNKPPEDKTDLFNVKDKTLPILDKYTEDEKDLYLPLQKDVHITKISKRTQDKAIYIDASCFIYQFVKDNRLEEGMENLIDNLRDLQKPFVFVMDNPDFKNLKIN